MIGTIISVIFALLIYLTAISPEAMQNLPTMGIILIAVATLFLFFPTAAIALAWAPVQRAEEQLTPRVSELFLKDKWIKYLSIVLMLFPLISYIMAIDLLFLNIFNKKLMLAVWVVLLGISLDALRHLLRRVFYYFDPFRVVSLFKHESNLSIQDDREEDLCNWIEALSEVAIRGMQRSSTSLCIQVNDELQHIIHVFLKSSKSISHASQDRIEQAAGEGDKVSYTLFFFLQRLEMIHDKALEKRIEPVCSNLVTVLGKTAIDAAKYDMTMPGYPLHFLGKFAATDQQRGMTQVGPKAILTLLEVAKTILNEIDITYLTLEDTFSSLITQMNTITKEIFRQDKSISIKLLTQPFRDLKDLFTSEKMANHQDTPAILQKIDMVLTEYDALETIMRTIPTIPPVPLEEEKK